MRAAYRNWQKDPTTEIEDAKFALVAVPLAIPAPDF